MATNKAIIKHALKASALSHIPFVLFCIFVIGTGSLLFLVPIVIAAIIITSTMWFPNSVVVWKDAPIWIKIISTLGSFAVTIVLAILIILHIASQFLGWGGVVWLIGGSIMAVSTQLGMLIYSIITIVRTFKRRKPSE